MCWFTTDWLRRSGLSICTGRWGRRRCCEWTSLRCKGWGWEDLAPARRRTAHPRCSTTWRSRCSQWSHLSVILVHLLERISKEPVKPELESQSSRKVGHKYWGLIWFTFECDVYAIQPHMKSHLGRHHSVTEGFVAGIGLHTCFSPVSSKIQCWSGQKKSWNENVGCYTISAALMQWHEIPVEVLGSYSHFYECMNAIALCNKYVKTNQLNLMKDTSW